MMAEHTLAMTTELARLQHFGPNWFASVMGTGIVATAGATLPVHVPGLHVFSRWYGWSRRCCSSCSSSR